jgi:hypothetical protein
MKLHMSTDVRYEKEGSYARRRHHVMLQFGEGRVFRHEIKKGFINAKLLVTYASITASSLSERKEDP